MDPFGAPSTAGSNVSSSLALSSSDGATPGMSGKIAVAGVARTATPIGSPLPLGEGVPLEGPPSLVQSSLARS